MFHGRRIFIKDVQVKVETESDIRLKNRDDSDSGGFDRATKVLDAGYSGVVEVEIRSCACCIRLNQIVAIKTVKTKQGKM